MKCSKCGTELEVAPAAYPGEHTASVCRDVLAERLAWFREMPTALRLVEVEAQLAAERAKRLATMSTPKDPGHRLHELMAALADETASLSDKDVVDDATADGIDIKAEAARVRGVLLSGLQRAKVERLGRALAEREKVLASLKSSTLTLPGDASARRALLARVFERKPQMRDAVMTLQHRNFESLSDDDVESVLKQLEHLGVLDDDSETKK